MLNHFKSVVIEGRKFDRGMILFEFDAFREPERTRFPIIGNWLKSRCEFRKIETPKALWRGEMIPDPYIANQLSGIPRSVDFQRNFIEPMCRKIAGVGYSEIEEKYHRALWLPLYWPQTLESRTSLKTDFYYPRAGYAWAALEGIELPAVVKSTPLEGIEKADLFIAYVVGAARFSVLFVVDDSPIYRITYQGDSKLVVEYRGYCDVGYELKRLGIIGTVVAEDFMRLPLPTKANVAKGWKPAKNMNEQLWEIMRAEACS